MHAGLRTHAQGPTAYLSLRPDSALARPSTKQGLSSIRLQAASLPIWPEGLSESAFKLQSEAAWATGAAGQVTWGRLAQDSCPSVPYSWSGGHRPAGLIPWQAPDPCTAQVS